MKWTTAGMILVAGLLLAGPAQAGKGKPKATFDPIQVNLGDGLAYLNGPLPSTPNPRGGKSPRLEVAVRGAILEFPFGVAVFGDPEGTNCFYYPPENMPGGVFILYESGEASLNIYPEWGLKDGSGTQLYDILLEGEHFIPNFSDLLADGGALTGTATFDWIDIRTEGRGQNRRLSCTGTFDEGFSATVTFFE
jgi:hypothetical protein